MLPKELNDLLVIDIETVACAPSYESLSPKMQQLWTRKAALLDATTPPEEVFLQKANLYAEFGKIISIGCGYFRSQTKNELSFRVKILSDPDEKKLLTLFKQLIESKFNQQKLRLVAHNGKEFDYPYLSRRMLVNGITPPWSLLLFGKRPWQIEHFDTLELWRCGEMRHWASLELLCEVFGISNQASQLDGAAINQAYYQTDSLAAINKHCLADVLAVARLYLRFRSLPPLHDDAVEVIE